MDSTQVCPPPWPQKTMGEEVMGAPLGRRPLCPAVNPGTAVQVQLRRLRLGGPALRSHSPEHGVGAPRSRRAPLGQDWMGVGVAAGPPRHGHAGLGGGLQNPGRRPGGLGWRLGWRWWLVDSHHSGSG